MTSIAQLPDSPPTECRERDTRLDVLRGTTMIIVVLGHVIMYTVSMPAVALSRMWILAENVLWAFHMPLFAYLSGWAVSLGSGPGIRGFLWRRVRSVIIPYAAWTTIALAVSISGVWEFMAPVPGGIIGGFAAFDRTAILALLDFFWFLPAIFGCYAMLWIAERTGYRHAWMLVAAVAAIGLNVYLMWTGRMTWAQGISWLLPFFVLGAIAKEHTQGLRPAVWLAVAGGFACGVWLMWPIVGSDPKWMPAALTAWLVAGGIPGTVVLPRLLPVLVKYMTAGLGIVLALGASGVFMRARGSRRLASIGVRSLGIYVTHPFIAALLVGLGVTNIFIATLITLGLALVLVLAFEATRPTALVLLGLPMGRGGKVA